MNYCFTYKFLIGIEWVQMCEPFTAHDDREAVQYALHRVKGCNVKDKFLIPYERLVRV